jgi:hypothetical protein
VRQEAQAESESAAEEVAPDGGVGARILRSHSPIVLLMISFMSSDGGTGGSRVIEGP